MARTPDDEIPRLPSKQELFKKYKDAIIPVITIDHDGDEHIGSAFHVGDGFFVTARHVVEGQRRSFVHALKNKTESTENDDFGLGYEHTYEIDIDVQFHENENTDIGCFHVDALRDLPSAELGGHLDDWLSSYDFVLDDVLVMGFPPIPLSRSVVLVACHGHINAQVDLMTAPHVHFIVSVTSRGGFSGGLVLHESGFALGLITQSLVKNGAPEELGYLTVLTVEPILECLAKNGMMPKAVADFWEGLFTQTTQHYGKPEKRWAQGWIATDKGGSQARFEFACPSQEVVSACIQGLQTIFADIDFKYIIKHSEVHQFYIEPEIAGLDETLERARVAAEQIFEAAGFLRVDDACVMHRTLDEPALF